MTGKAVDRPAPAGAPRPRGPRAQDAGPTRLALAAGVATVCLAAGAHMILATQGWKGAIPHWDDDVIPIAQAEAFVASGRLPEIGMMSSYRSLTPPGPAWLIVPGVLLFDDPRLFELPGVVMTHVGAIVGLVLLGRLHFGWWTGVVAAVVYAASSTSFEHAGDLARGSLPGFYVWLTLWLSWWVHRRRPAFLGGALITLAAGLYVQLEFLPAAVVPAALWLRFRPPVRAGWIVLAGALAVALWWPYLRFEASRDFADLRSQLLMQERAPADSGDWCDPGRTLDGRESRATPAALRGAAAAGARALTLLRAFDGDLAGRHRSVSAVLLGVVGFGLILTTGAGRVLGSRAAVPLAVGLLAAAAVLNEMTAARFAPDGALAPESRAAIRLVQAAFAMGGLALLFRRRTAALLVRLRRAFPAGPGDPQVVAIALTAAWLVLALAIEHGRIDRLAGIWPLQGLVLAATGAACIRAVSARPAWLRLGAVALVAGIGSGPLTDGTTRLLRNGWGGTDAVEVRALDRLAAAIRARGQTRARIGYHVGFARADSHRLEPPLRVGAEFDLVLRRRHGIANVGECREGLSPADEFRIVEILVPADEGYAFRLSDQDEYDLIGGEGQYGVYRRRGI